MIYTKIEYDSTNWDKNYKKIKEWAITEKVHGANFSFVYTTSSNTINFAKRNCILKEDDVFFGYRSILPSTLQKIENIIKEIKDVKEKITDINTISIFGELFGKDVQSGIFYSNDIHFYAFDIGIKLNDGTTFYLDFSISLNIFKNANILYAKPLKIVNSYQKATEYNIYFNSTIPKLLNKSIDTPNLAEGIVIRSMSGRYISKIKIKEFTENVEIFDNNSYLPSKLDSYIIGAKNHMTKNRFNCAISKVGTFEDNKDEIYNLYINDILSEINGFGVDGLYEWIYENKDIFF